MTSDKNRPITLADIEHLATKDDLKNFATKDDLKNFTTKADFASLKDELRGFASKADFASLRDELREFRSEFVEFKDWTQNTLDWVVGSVGQISQELTVLRHSRMRRFHERITRVEKKVGLPPEEYY